LIALGKQLDLLRQEYAAAIIRCQPLWDEHKRLLDQWRAAHPYPRMPGQFEDAYHRIGREIGLDAIEIGDNHPDDIMNRVDPVSRAIMAMPATTVAGLAVKARLAAFGADSFWDETDKDADWDQLLMRKLVDAVIELARCAERRGFCLLARTGRERAGSRSAGFCFCVRALTGL
jgi:hypothetical protein